MAHVDERITVKRDGVTATIDIETSRHLLNVSDSVEDHAELVADIRDAVELVADPPTTEVET